MDTACSARSLATLLVAWVCAAMVASILLRWSYMWIALAILTLIFLIACGYTACNTRRAPGGYLNQGECARQQRRGIDTVAGRLDHNYCSEPPRYQTYWITDLPPPYSSSLNGQSINPHVVAGEQILTSVLPPGPPSYTVAMQTCTTATTTNSRLSRQIQRSTNSTRRIYRSQSYSPPRTCDKKKSSDVSDLAFLNDHDYNPNFITIRTVSNQRIENNNHNINVNIESPNIENVH